MKFNNGSDGLCILLYNICIKIPSRRKEVEIQKIAAKLKISPKIFFMVLVYVLCKEYMEKH